MPKEFGMTKSQMYSTIYLAGGCFWGLEAFLKRLPGVHHTQVGYANGTTQNPNYCDVCYRNTGHAETVLVQYDKSVISLDILLDAFFTVTDPTSLNRQGNDCGVQYRSGIYWVQEGDVPIIRQALERQRHLCARCIVTESEPLTCFYPAEEAHQNYLEHNPGGYCHIDLAASEPFIALLSDQQDYRENTTDNIYELIQNQGYQAPDNDTLKELLSHEEYQVVRRNATEAPFSHPLNDHNEVGIYVDIVSGEPLFSSDAKFESGCGWPAFSRPLADQVITELTDYSFGSVRTEVRSEAGDAHLGHVFADGPLESGGLRYCINGSALRFIAYDNLEHEGYGYLKPFVTRSYVKPPVT